MRRVEMMLKLLLSMICFMGTVSCHSGTWDDDPKNWERAFNGQKVPPEVQVLHSHYWRSPHFTYEADYQFEFTAPQAWMEMWISHAQVTPAERAELNLPGPPPDKPTFFLPKPMGHYEMWKPTDDEYDSFRIYRDRETGVWYVCDSQGQ